MRKEYLQEYPYIVRDLTNNTQNLSILKIADKLHNSLGSKIIAIDKELCSDSKFVQAANPLFLEALNLAASKYLLETSNTPFHISVVWAMYNETARLKTKALNEHGEDSLRIKVAQLNWLFKGIEKSSWDIVICDDGCPETPSSTEIAQQIIDTENFGKDVEIIKLQDAIDNKTFVNKYFENIKSTSDSRKGGSILLGMSHALKKNKAKENHIVMFTDADLSANLGQIGKLIRPILTDNKSCTVGQRYGLNGAILVKESGAVTEPESTREKTGKLLVLFRHFVRVKLIPSLEHILDTQAGFKAFKAEDLEKVIPEITSFQELFDIELLINIVKNKGKESVGVMPILFTEDFALTNFPSLKPGEGHLNMIKQIIAIYENNVADHQPAPRDYLAFFKSLDLPKFVALIEHLNNLDIGDLSLFERRWTLDELDSFNKMRKSA
tara:strand:- start:2089 stop:3405 length:1317 start_codon:yes stop_codon:yes gene_type:complete